MTAGILIAIVLAGAGVAFVVAPLLRKDAAEAERRSAVHSEARELRSRQDMLLDSLRDLEEDRASDRVAEADYARFHASLSAQAVDVMQRLDVIEEQHRPRPKAATPLKHPGLRGPGSSS